MQLAHFGHTIVVFLSTSILMSCVSLNSPANEQATPNKATSSSWLKDTIAKAKEQPHFAQAIYRLQSDSETYYLVVPGCCDRFSVLYTEEGKSVCAPSGGFTGRGDGKCTHLDLKAMKRTKIWDK